jgi:hypothetical protein
VPKVYKTLECKSCGKSYEHWHYASAYCSSECYNKNIYRKNKHKYLNKEYSLKKRYGLSYEEFNRMKQEQNNSCAICKKHSEALCVDHCHTTGQVRKLLCKKCNMALGLLHEDEEIIKEMLEYIKADLKKLKGV